MTIDADDITTLHTAAVDARIGYYKALEEADGGGLTTLFQEMIAIHTENAEELKTEIRKLGVEVDDEGSIMSTVHRSIMEVRSLFGGLNSSILPSLIDGEKRNAKKYEDVIAKENQHHPLLNLLLKQQHRIVGQIELMEAKLRP
jgi:uncharacterized protein (TIGR02284 family)